MDETLVHTVALRVDCIYHEALDSSVQVRDVVRTGTFISEVIN